MGVTNQQILQQIDGMAAILSGLRESVQVDHSAHVRARELSRQSAVLVAMTSPAASDD